MRTIVYGLIYLLVNSEDVGGRFSLVIGFITFTGSTGGRKRTHPSFAAPIMRYRNLPAAGLPTGSTKVIADSSCGGAKNYRADSKKANCDPGSDGHTNPQSRSFHPKC